MMPFGRNNRSQHKLVEPGSAVAGPGPVGSLSASASSVSSPPSAPFSSSELEPFDTTSKGQEFADQVARSQSQRYPQIPALQTQQQYATASSSADDLHNTVPLSSPLVLQGQPLVLPSAPQLQPQQLQGPPPKPKQSTRKLIKNILSGSSSSRGPELHHQQPPPNSYDNTAGLARRPSKRVSTTPAIRTGVSQVSLEQQQDWQSQGVFTQPSPLQGVEELTDQYLVGDPNQDPRLLGRHQDLPSINTIRQVPADSETSPYAPEDLAYQQQQGHIQLQGQVVPPGLQRHYSQPHVSYDPAQQQQQQFQFADNSPSTQYQDAPPPVFTSHLGNPQQQNPETVSQLSHESPVTDSDHQPPSFQPTASSPGVTYPPIQTQDIPRRPSQAQTTTPTQQQGQQINMPLQQPGVPPPNRRSQDTDKAARGQADAPPGPPPNYRHSQAPNLGNMNPLPPPPGGAAAPNPAFRGAAGADRQPQYDIPPDQRTGSPGPGTGGDPGEQDKAFKDLLTKYKNVKRLYFEGKNQIDQLNTQIEHLQNAVANQRMSQSRTSLDDNEYTTRFNRLNGAINNLSFNIRKDWVTLPSWLDRFVSPEALKTGKQEMTAVGRAIISRWVFEEIFNRCFHPGLEPDLSRQLKEIEANIRRFSYTMTSQEEFDALTNKVVGWRMATLEGLQRMLQGPESGGHRSDFTRRATSNLTAILYQHLAEPPPQGVEGSASMIVELAVGLASNLPLESRDVAIVYPLPMDPVQPDLMEIEKTGLPTLESQPSDVGEGGGGAGAEARAADEGAAGSGKEGSEKASSGKDRRGDKASRSAAAAAAAAASAQATPVPAKDTGKVRLAGFMAVEVRGRQVLVKAPIWTMV